MAHLHNLCYLRIGVKQVIQEDIGIIGALAHARYARSANPIWQQPRRKNSDRHHHEIHGSETFHLVQ